MKSIVWQPSQQLLNHSTLRHFMQFLDDKYTDYPALYQWSIEQPAQFWQELARFFKVNFKSPYKTVLNDHQHPIKARWFEGARLNFAEHLLRHCNEKTAIVSYDEQYRRRELSGNELRANIGRLANTLKNWGIKPGDRVAAVMPNIPETLIAMLATTSLGAIWSSTSPDFGFQGIIDRFEQIKPKLLIACDGHRYNSKPHDGLDKIQQVVHHIKSIEQVVIVPFLNESPRISPPFQTWQDALSDDETLHFASLPFNHPLVILFSSGTTGQPKCIVHGAGGTLLQHLKELSLHSNLTANDNLFFYTTCGWMMWNWMASALALGTRLVLYDGSPTFDTPRRLFDLIENEKVTVFGTSAKFISAIEKLKFKPHQSHDLHTLQTILTTGSPLLPANYDFVYQHIKPDVQLSSISGGTDIISCFALGNPLTPVYRGELQCLGLGMKVEIFDDQARPCHQQKGELVCTLAFPSMPVGFWADNQQSKYYNAYFNHFEGVWAHGDYAEITRHQGLIIYGRSDAILNPGGVRIGTAEIYRQVEKIPQIIDSVVIGQAYQDDVRVVLFVKLQQGITLSEQFIQDIKSTIRSHTTPRHVPAKILEVTDIPRTQSGKIVELAVKHAVEGRPVKNLSSLANPKALEQFKERRELS